MSTLSPNDKMSPPNGQTASPPSTTCGTDDFSFNATWNTNDRSALLPSHLALSKAHRAWDRKPQSPFSRRRFRVGKVWKRANSGGSSSSTLSSTANIRPTISPLKAVKKLCLDSGFGIGAQVRNWESKGSPVARRIVTRSTASHHEPEDRLVALWDVEHEDQPPEDALIHIVHEDGTEEFIDTNTMSANDEVWVDVGGEEEQAIAGEKEEELETFDDTLMHLGQAIDHATDSASHDMDAVEIRADASSATTDSNEGDEADAPVLSADDGMSTETNRERKDQGETESTILLAQGAADQSSPEKRARSPVKHAPIPQGFVSPAVRRRRSIKQARQSFASRRNTLPVNFATTPFSNLDFTEVNANPFDNNDVLNSTTSDVETQLKVGIDTGKTGDPTVQEDAIKQERMAITRGDDDEWEDMETSDTNDTNFQAESRVGETTVHDTDIVRSAEDMSSSDSSGTVNNPPGSSRGLPRRKSSSPTKQSSFRPDSERSHLIAFTPVKLPIFSFSAVDLENADCSPVTGTPTRASNADAPEFHGAWTRASSAPPEQPRMSPQKPRQPRISDDTALLQAFLNRAAENKSSRRLSETARRESLENRRDSDSVRRALAGVDAPPAPVTPTVLMDLDPNSPSPRKSTFGVEASGPAGERKADDLVEDESIVLESSHKANSRRSGRVKRQPETLAATTYTAPNKISIRSTNDTVVLKKTEAQELAMLTRSNTRKNKGGSMLPPLRLTKLAKEVLTDGNPDAPEEINANAGGKTVQWAETLTTFRHFSPESDESFVPDETMEALSTSSILDTETESIDVLATTLPPAGTSSKPRTRRMKPTRVSSTSVKLIDKEFSSVAVDTAIPVPTTTEIAKPKATKRKSRIATPAKVKGKSLLSLSDDLEEASTNVNYQSNTKTMSKLSAPSGTTLTSHSTGSAVGKEGSLIASPPKKRLRPATTSASLRSSNGTSISKLDLSKPSVNFDVGHRNTDPSSTSGLASPAKRRSGAFFMGSEGPSALMKTQNVDGSPVLGLGSPAKKRSRRVIRP